MATAIPEPADAAEALAGLNWETNGGKSADDGKGCALRVWDQREGDVYITWDGYAKPADVVAFDVYFGWRLFPAPRMMRSSRQYDAPYLDALYRNALGQAAHTRIPAAASCCAVDRPASNGGPCDYYYVKLVAVHADGRFSDVRGWAAGSERSRRANHLPPPPSSGGPPFEIVRPKGNYEWHVEPFEPYGNKPRPQGI